MDLELDHRRAGMRLPSASKTPAKTVWDRVSSRPRHTVILCFGVVFVVTLILAVHQYFLVRARELDNRSHRLEIQARVLDVAVRNNRQHLQFLRESAERLLADRTAQLDRTPDASLQAVLRAQDERVWNLQVRDIDAPIRGIGTQQLAVTPGLHRDEPTFVEDLRLAQMMSRLFAVQFQMGTGLERAVYVSPTGIVVAHPTIDDDEVVRLLQMYGSSRLLQLANQNPLDYDVTFDPVRGRKNPAGPRLLFGTAVMSNDVVRGLIFFVVPQRIVQDYLWNNTTADETHALIDPSGMPIATSGSTFSVNDENWLKTLPAQWNTLSASTLFRTPSGTLSAGQDFLLFRKLDTADLVLTDYVSAATVFFSVVRLSSALFAGVWILMALLLWATLFVVDQLLSTQMALNGRLRELSLADPLTGLANRRRLNEEFDALSRRNDERRIALLMIDIDHFKVINDNWGHTAGDETLKHLANVVRIAVRPGDLMARLGGEEFCVLLPDTTADDAARIAERVREAVARNACVLQETQLTRTAPGREIWFTISIGVAESVSDNCFDLEGLIAVADQRLYAAKAGGRNRVVASESMQS
ncbi:diguanylate cyclase [Paraburkholderia sp. Cpub6]|uniref:diguanylate cyclase n=1 Tax=Paraburkholderia sp. Cpub6 TaxID=2723094 RepID=UPI0016164744|nr:diguanylate cyclase [Paraburkholderia sp. Cpub6]MBB5456521.1 diguanylate cyclase (GGDEF)-like protein [Paraburkholderia sp. Cpub6]